MTSFHLPSLSDYLPNFQNLSKATQSLASHAVQAARSLTSQLPQNEHGKKADSLAQEIQSLEHSLTQKTDQLFQDKISNVTSKINKEKEKCIVDLNRMNGAYYQDPKSVLKKTWDKLVESVKIAIDVTVENTDQLDAVLAQLNDESNDAKKVAQEKIRAFTYIQEKRDARQAQLNLILSTEKAEPNFEGNFHQKKEKLQQEHRQLCGSYFGDPNGKLDQAWQTYQTALTKGAENADVLLAAYQKLDTYRKTLEAQLYRIDQELSFPVSTTRTYETLATESLTQEVAALKKLQQTESDLSTVDWKKTASQTTKVALIAAGYILLL